MLRFTTFIALSIAAVQPAFAATPMEHGESDGERFEYTTELRAGGIIRLAGIVLGSNEQFVLDVRPNGHVDGSFGNVPVEYNVSKRLRDSVAAQLDKGAVLAEAGSGK